MKATGIIRKVDDLGRVVIPKEIRRTLRIREGAPLEIFTHNGAVCFKPYSPIGEKDWQKARVVAEALLTCGFSLLDNSHGEQITVQRDAREFDLTYTLYIDGDVAGYLLIDSADQEPEDNIKRTVKVLESLFADEG